MTSNSRGYWMSWELRFICCLCQLFAGVMVTCIPSYCLFLAYSSPKSSPLDLRYSVGLACYFSLNLYISWIQFRWKLIFNDVFGKNTVGYMDCSRCSSSVPIGSYHCPICNVCVWRRDHHCFFLGGCVGFSNLNHFLSFCLNACLGCAYALFLLWHYLNVEFHPLWSQHFIYYIIPYTFAQWLTGNVVTHLLVAVVVFNAVVAAFITTLFMFSLQVYLIFISKTSYQFLRKGSCSNNVLPMKSWHNFERTLGSNWFPYLFFPFCTLNPQRLLTLHKKDTLNEAMKYV